MIEFKRINEFPKGILYDQLVDAYSFNDECRKNWDIMWKEHDDFFTEIPLSQINIFLSPFLTENP